MRRRAVAVSAAGPLVTAYFRGPCPHPAEGDIRAAERRSVLNLSGRQLCVARIARLSYSNAQPGESWDHRHRLAERSPDSTFFLNL